MSMISVFEILSLKKKIITLISIMWKNLHICTCHGIVCYGTVFKPPYSVGQTFEGFRNDFEDFFPFEEGTGLFERCSVSLCRSSAGKLITLKCKGILDWK